MARAILGVRNTILEGMIGCFSRLRGSRRPVALKTSSYVDLHLNKPARRWRSNLEYLGIAY